MKCSVRLLTYVVNLFLISLSFSGVLTYEEALKIAKEEIKKRFGEDVKIKEAEAFLSRSIEYRKIRKVDVNARRSIPRASVHIYLETEKGTRRITVNLKLLWKCEVLKASEVIDTGERVYPWKVYYGYEFLERCPRKEFSNAEELINYVALRRIEKEEIIKRSYLRKEPLIRRGEEINVIYRSGALEISFYGIALENGYFGEYIRIKSRNTGKILKGKVISEGAVIIED